MYSICRENSFSFSENRFNFFERIALKYELVIIFNNQTNLKQSNKVF